MEENIKKEFSYKKFLIGMYLGFLLGGCIMFVVMSVVIGFDGETVKKQADYDSTYLGCVNVYTLKLNSEPIEHRIDEQCEEVISWFLPSELSKKYYINDGLYPDLK